MTWFDWILVTLLVLGVVVNVLFVGRERDPITPGVALLSVVVNAFLAYGVVRGW
jgi:hypothetical protein